MTAVSPYSFSMMNLVKLLPDWSWDGFDRVMAKAGTSRVELVPSMVLGVDWDQHIYAKGDPVQEQLQLLIKRYTVESIQSLTYGLQINLADQLINHPGLVNRLKGLGQLSKATGCSVLILGSPGQKKKLSRSMSSEDHKQRFIVNCGWMAKVIGPELMLSLEHNTRDQGAEYCNTLADIVEVVKTLRQAGTINVGINLDTKCLIHEFGANVRVAELLANSELAGLVTSIQVSFDFLTREVPHRSKDQHQLMAFAHARDLALSLEEFGLLENQLYPFVKAWNS